MNKTKWLKSLAVVASSAMPVATILTTASSCSQKDYAQLVLEMKDDCIQRFMSICKNVHRNAWNEGQAYEYVKTEMSGLGFVEPTGYDVWSKLNAVKRVRIPELEILKKDYDEKDWGDYGNLWYDLKPTSGYEDVPGLIIHCHMDSPMYFGPDDEAALHKKWSANGLDINYDRDNELLNAKGNMSLGADGGVGIAALITLAKYHTRFNHGPIRLLFCVGESEPISPYENGEVKYPEYYAGFHLLKYDQSGICPSGETEGGETATWEHKGKPFGDDSDPWKYRYIISTSGITENTICVSSSGVHECQVEATGSTEAEINGYEAALNKEHSQDGNVMVWEETKDIPWQGTSNKKWMSIAISGLQGGATSAYIDTGRANALKLMCELLYCGDTDLQLIKTWSYPNNPYSISQVATAQFSTFYDTDTWDLRVKALMPTFKSRWPQEDWENVKITFIEHDLEKEKKPVYGISKQASRDVLSMIANNLYYGPMDWFENGDVKTSENMGPLDIEINQSIPIPSGETRAQAVELYLGDILRSSDVLQLEMFKQETHAIFKDGLGFLFGYKSGEPEELWKTIEEAHIAHIHDPAWEAPTASNPNILQKAFETAFNNFKIGYRVVNEHGWIEVSSVADIFLDSEGKEIPHHKVLVGVQVENHHTAQEVLYTDSLTTMLETIIYVVDNAKGLLPKLN